ncbi:MAG: RluA family pseudouridine synthase [Treponema sp.]|nr:RluA family pseudouridine synthase [Treponema sp.]
MEFTDFVTGPNDYERRFDKIIRRFLPSMSLSEIYKLMRKGLIKLNKKKSSPEIKIQEGDTISIASFLLDKKLNSTQKTNSPNILKKDIPLLDEKNILFQNQHLFIVNKAYDIKVHSDNSQISLDKIVKAYYQNNVEDNSLSFTPGPLHRLDRKTSGIIVFSWSIKGAHWFSQNIQNHSIKKTYRAIFQGHLDKSQEWRDGIKKDNNQKKAFKTVDVKSDFLNNEAYKDSITKVIPIKKAFYNKIPITYAEIEIKTGRQHQIRAQGAAHGFPLLGDTAYGGEKLDFHGINFFLHAFKLEFPEKNPIDIPQIIECPLPKEFQEFISFYKLVI